MTVKVSDIERAARLSGIRISEEDHDLFITRISRVFDWVTSLQNVDTGSVAAMANPMENFPELQQPLRQDIPVGGSLQKEILSNAPATEHTMFKVNKVIE